MADGPQAPPAEMSYTRRFPWLRLFRAFGVASDAKKLILAALGLVLWQFGGAGLDRLFSRPGPAPSAWGILGTPVEDGRVAHVTVYPILSVISTETLPSLGESARSQAAAPWWRPHKAPWRVTEPVRALVAPFLVAFSSESDAGTFLHALSSAFLSVLIWGLVGGAIARIALLQVTRSRGLGLTGAIRFAARHAVALVGTPLCPLLGVAIFAAPCALFGLLYRIPGQAGVTVAGALAFLPLLAGLVMTLILIGLALAWPLMPPAVAAEAEDSFDALSRTYAYVNQRRGLYLFYALLAWATGAVGLIFVDVFAHMVVTLARWALEFSSPRGALGPLWETGWRGLHGFWVGLVALLAHAWVYSYFWSSGAIAYLLLRHDVDGTPLHEVWTSDAAFSSAGSLTVPNDTE